MIGMRILLKDGDDEMWAKERIHTSVVDQSKF